jgi:hypothetical protein
MLELAAAIPRRWWARGVAGNLGEVSFSNRSPASHGTALVEQAFRRIAPPRRNLYYCGMALTAIGALLFVSVMVVFIMNFGRTDHLADRVQAQGLRALGGIVLVLLGSLFMRIGYAGWAGSGILLDPARQRRDLEPFSRMAGGMVRDALSEVDGSVATLVKVRCTHCQALNDETAESCDRCGAAV